MVALVVVNVVLDEAETRDEHGHALADASPEEHRSPANALDHGIREECRERVHGDVNAAQNQCQLTIETNILLEDNRAENPMSDT